MKIEGQIKVKSLAKRRARLVSHLTSCQDDLDDTSEVKTDLIEILAIKDQIRH